MRVMKKKISIFHSESKTLWYGILFDPNVEENWEIVKTFSNLESANDWMK
jgi:hypothetical protein